MPKKSKKRQAEENARESMRDGVSAAYTGHTFPIGARVLVDGRDEAIVKYAYPMGSTSHRHPHYKVDFVDGDKDVAVPFAHVGVDRAPKPAVTYYAYRNGAGVEVCLRNGSFLRTGKDGKTAVYMNGDYMGNVGDGAGSWCPDAIDPEKYVEVDAALAERLIPKCCGGRG